MYVRAGMHHEPIQNPADIFQDVVSSRVGIGIMPQNAIIRRFEQQGIVDDMHGQRHTRRRQRSQKEPSRKNERAGCSTETRSYVTEKAGSGTLNSAVGNPEPNAALFSVPPEAGKATGGNTYTSPFGLEFPQARTRVFQSFARARHAVAVLQESCPFPLALEILKNPLQRRNAVVLGACKVTKNVKVCLDLVCGKCSKKVILQNVKPQ